MTSYVEAYLGGRQQNRLRVEREMADPKGKKKAKIMAEANGQSWQKHLWGYEHPSPQGLPEQKYATMRLRITAHNTSGRKFIVRKASPK